jgi:glycosyltransferase involved in cell wall biosynthesis
MNSEDKSVTIIIPTRNRASALARCLDAVSQQKTDGYVCKVVVVDDCSSDGTADLVHRLCGNYRWAMSLIKQNQPLGANSARNRALEAAEDEVVVFLDDDVVVPPEWLGTLLAGLRQAGCPVVSGAVRVNIEGAIVGKHRQEVRGYFGEVLAPPLSFDGAVVPLLGNMAALRAVFSNVKFDETVRPPLEEADWLRRAGVKASFVPEAWVWHCKSSDELRLKRVLAAVWHRGSESGWYMRERMQMPRNQRLRLASRALITSARAFIHAFIRRCWGGVVVGTGEVANAMAVVGLINRQPRHANSWR